MASISVIVPAYNEERHLPATLTAIEAARRHASNEQVEVIVVDNDSTDRTPAAAAKAGATVVREPVRNVARARNTGAASANGESLVFIDADTIIPERLLDEIARAMRDPACIGGAVDARHMTNRPFVRLYLRFWQCIGTVAGMAQGATQFCRRDVFRELHGYDESLWMGEDVDFHWRLKALARRRNARVAFLRHVWVVPSPRRFDQWPVWKILLFTNPLFALLFRRRRSAWRGWYDEVVR